jgi:MFS family permease
VQRNDPSISHYIALIHPPRAVVIVVAAVVVVAATSTMATPSSSPSSSAAPSSTTTIITITIDEAIDRLGYGRFQRRILVAVGLCSASDAMEILLLSFLSVAVQVEWNLTHAQASSLIAVVFVGAFVGTLLLGRLGDLKGRRPTFVATAAIVATFGLVSCVCQTFEQLLLARFFVGLGIGGVTVPFDTYSEFLPTASRGKLLSLPSYFWTAGTILVAVVARFTLGQDSSRWRLLCLYCSIPCIAAVLVGAIAVPESPRWLLTQSSSSSSRQHEEVLATLREAARTNGKDPYLLFPADITIKGTSSTSSNTTTTTLNSYSDVLRLMSPQWIRISLLIGFVWFGYACMYYGTVLVITMVFSSTSTNAEDEDDGDGNGEKATFHFDYGAIFISTLAEVTGATVVFFTIDRFGRRNVHSISFIMGGTMVLLLCLFAKANRARGLLVGLAFLGRMFIFCGSSITWVWTAELLTNDLRTTGHSIANAAGRIGGLVAPFLVSRNRSLSTIGMVMALICALIVTCSRYLPDTHGLPMGTAADGTAGGHRKGKVYENVGHAEEEDGDEMVAYYDENGARSYQHSGMEIVEDTGQKGSRVIV